MDDDGLGRVISRHTTLGGVGALGGGEGEGWRDGLDKTHLIKGDTYIAEYKGLKGLARLFAQIIERSRCRSPP